MKTLFGIVFAALLIYALANLLHPSFAGWVIIGLVAVIVFFWYLLSNILP